VQKKPPLRAVLKYRFLNEMINQAINKFPCFFWDIPSKPIIAEPNSQIAAGTGTACTPGPLAGANENYAVLDFTL